MSDALARVFALQQAEANRKRQQQLQFEAKREREIRAFVESPVWQLLNECKDLPLKTGAHYTLQSLMLYERDKVFAGRTDSVHLSNGTTCSGSSWRCQESRDTNVMLYTDPSGTSSPNGNGRFFDSFIEFLADRLQPEAVERAVRAAAERQAQQQEHRPRKLQTV